MTREKKTTADGEATVGSDGDGGGTRFPIVGLGASAGGLEALATFFEHTPPDAGMAFVVVTHQHPGHTSLMPGLLRNATQMPVSEAASGMRVEPNHVYVAPPGPDLEILGGVLELVPPSPDTRVRLPIDRFFRALARDQHERAVGIVLSGSGSDGTLGIKEIKGASGMVMVQEAASATHDGMPRSAIATGAVDYILPPGELPAQLAAYVAGPYLSREAPAPPEAVVRAALSQVFLLLRNHTGHDFSQYKRTTIRRRIERRMNVHHIAEVTRYVEVLRSSPAEIDLLFRELLIGVTSFFRDPDAFQVLEEDVLPTLLDDKPTDHVFRAWVAGCSTGEEAYSLAILLREALGRSGRYSDVQIFATDIDAAAIDTARAGVYPVSIAADVSPERLKRHFVHDDGCYRVRKEIREMLVFAQQNVIDDPPFTKLDLLSCRNLLIYLDASLQQRIIPLFHYALRTDGVLLLGASEAVGAYGALFATVDKKWKVFRRKEAAQASLADFPAALRATRDVVPGPQLTGQRKTPGARLAHRVERALLDELIPPTAVVHERGDVVHIHGRTGRYLEPPPGPQPNANIFYMARQGLQVELATAIRQASTAGADVVRTGVRVTSDEGHVFVDLRVHPIEKPEALKGLYAVSFVPARSPTASTEPVRPDAPPDRVAELVDELQHLKENHQGTVEELETANEELKSTNEELQSTNEELQSANEELETSKEEMQSLNEELQTVNAELQGKLEELSRANDDMKNLLNGTDIATVFLDNDLNIKRFTEQAREVIRLIPTDVGRPIGDLVSKLHYDDLVDDANEVLRTLVFKETEVRGEGDDWYLMRILPYRTTDNVIDGLVITFVDIRKVRGLQESERQLVGILEGSSTAVFTADADLRYVSVSNPVFGLGSDVLLGRTDAEVLPEQEATALGELKARVLATSTPVREQLAVDVEGRTILYDLYLSPMVKPDGTVCGVAGVVNQLSARP